MKNQKTDAVVKRNQLVEKKKKSRGHSRIDSTIHDQNDNDPLLLLRNNAIYTKVYYSKR